MARRPNRNNKAEKDNFQDEAMKDEKLKGERDASERLEKNSKSNSQSKGKTADAGEDSDQHKRATVAIYTGAKNPIDMHSFNDAYLQPLGKLTTNLRNGYPELLETNG